MSDIGAEVRIWAFPIAALIIVGLVTWGTIGWQVGIFPLLLAAIAIGVLAGLNHRRVRAWREEQLDAPRLTARRLRGLQRRGYAVLQVRTHTGDSASPGLDHLIVGPSGVCALTSKRYDRQIPMRTMYHNLFHGPMSQRHVLEHATQGADRIAAAIRDSLRQEIDVAATVVVHGPHVPWKVLRIQGVNVLSARRLRRYIRSGGRRLSTVEIERVIAAAEAALPAIRDEQPSVAGARHT